MSYEFILPPLGEKIDSGEVVGIKVAVGDVVTKDQPAFELETDKAVIEVPIPIDGKVTEIKLKMGDKAKVGQIVMLLEAGTAKEPVAEKKVEVPAEKPVAKEEPKPAKVEAETTQKAPPQKEAPKKQEPVVEEKSEESSNDILASPSVRALAREMGVSLSQVKGSGSQGRVSTEDIKNYVSQNLSQESSESSGSNSAPSISKDLPDFAKWGAIEAKPMNGVRRATVKSMTKSWHEIPMVTQFESADITDILDLRKKFAKRVEQAGGKLTITAVILKVIGAALKVFPQFNASVDLESESVIYKKYIHVGVAVDTERGLLVPVIRDVDQKNIVDLSVDLNAMADKARQKKISPTDLEGATFTLTNLGSIATTYFTPIINWPQVAILGVGRSEIRPIWQEGAWVPRTILPLSVTYDHRVIDGADAGKFLKWVSEALGDLFLLDLEG